MKCDCGHHIGNRRRVGPTGKKSFMIRVDSCCECGKLYPVDSLSEDEQKWVNRWNKRMEK